MRLWTIISLVILFSLAFSLSGCSKECEVDADCTALEVCTAARCASGTCQYVTKQSCCGNGNCESATGENACSCAADCVFSGTEDGTCSGKVTFPDPRREGRTIPAERAEYYCDDNVCVVGLPASKVQNKLLLSEHPGVVSLEVVTSISQPFVVGKGTCSVRVKLTDIDASRAQGPVKLTTIQVLSRNELISEKALDVTLTNIGDFAEVDLTLTPTMTVLEEDRYFSVKLDYSYNALVADSYSLTRDSLETTQETVPFIDPGQVALQ